MVVDEPLSESKRLEYQEANNWWRTLSGMRRRDIALFTGGQGAVLAIIGSDLLDLNPDGWALSAIALLISVVGFNNEQRLYLYLRWFRGRAKDIEIGHGMSLISDAHAAVLESKATLGSTLAFQAYYLVIGLCWVGLWFANLW